MNNLVKRITELKPANIGIFIFLLTTYCLLLTSVITVHAQDKGIPPLILSVSPVLISISLSPDQSTDYPITLTNQLNQDLPVKINFADFRTATEDGGYQFVNTKTDPLLSWVSVPEDVLILRPKEKKDITLTVKTPKTIPFGAYYGMVYFEPILPVKTEQTKVLAKIAVLMMGSVGVSDPSATNAQILTFQTPSLTQQDNPLSILLRVKNTGINHFSAKPFVAIKPLFGKETTYELEEKFVFPSKVRRWDKDLSTNLTPWIYTAQVAVSIGNGKQIFTTTTFVVYPKNQTLLIIGIIILTLLAAIYRKRLITALSILLYDAKQEQKKEQTQAISVKSPRTKKKAAPKKREKNP